MILPGEIGLSGFSRGTDVNREAWRALVSEGINPELAHAEISLATQPEPINWVEVVNKTTDLIATPIDRATVYTTDVALWTLTKIRQTGNRQRLQVWEKWWENDRKSSLVDTDQKTILINWFADSMVPSDVLETMDKARPGSGAYHKALFEDIAARLIYSFPRGFIADLLTEFADGFSTIANVTAIGAGKGVATFFIQKIYKEMGKAWRGYWSAYYTMSSDLNTIFQNTKTDFNPETQMNELLHGFDNEFDYRMAQWEQHSTWWGLAAGVGAAMFAKEGPAGLAKAISMMLGLSFATKKAATHLVNDHVEEIVDRTADIQNTLRRLYENREKWQAISREVGVEEEVTMLLDESNELSAKKRVFKGVTETSIKSLITLVTAYLQDGTWAGGSMIAGSLWFSANDHKNREANYKYYQKLKAQSLAKIREAFLEQTHERGIISSTTTNAKESPELIKPSRKLQVKPKKIVLPRMGELGDEAKEIAFEQGFVIEAGNIIPVFGSNYSGKTTLLRVLSGEYESGSGTKLKIGRRDFTDLSKTEKQRLFRWIGRKGAGDDLFDLKVVVSEILLQFPANKILPNIDPERLKRWNLADGSDTELEERVLAYIQSQTDVLKVDQSWFTDTLRIPSGAEKAFLHLVLNMAIADEPLVILMDEVGGELTDQTFDHLLAYLKKVDFGQKALMPVVNVRKHDWLELQQVSGVIKLNDPVAGQIIDQEIPNKIDEPEKLAELVARCRKGETITPDQFAYVVSKSHGLTESLPVGLTGDEITAYLAKQLNVWLHTLATITTPGMRYSLDRLQYANQLLKAATIYLQQLSTDQNILKETHFERLFLHGLEQIKRNIYLFVPTNLRTPTIPVNKVIYIDEAILFSKRYNQFLVDLGITTMVEPIVIEQMFDFDRYESYVLKSKKHCCVDNPVLRRTIVEKTRPGIATLAREQIITHLKTLSTKKRRDQIAEYRRIWVEQADGTAANFWVSLGIDEHIDI